MSIYSYLWYILRRILVAGAFKLPDWCAQVQRKAAIVNIAAVYCSELHRQNGRSSSRFGRPMNDRFQNVHHQSVCLECCGEKLTGSFQVMEAKCSRLGQWA
jgi:hypothetical protein